MPPPHPRASPAPRPRLRGPLIRFAPSRAGPGRSGPGRRQDFGPRFVELARSVYKHNDERARLKRALSRAAGSVLVDEKLYAKY